MAEFDNSSDQQDAEPTQILGYRHELFAWMERNNIGKIIASFDGCGDQGQIEEVACYDPGDGEINDLPDLNEVHLPTRHTEDRYEPVTGKVAPIQSEATTVSAAIDELVYHYLDVEWSGWEDNDGAFGTVTFGLSTRQIIADISFRDTDTEDYSEEF
jgi:hypothetical protein